MRGPTLDERLKDQNNGEPWRDCNDADRGRPHRFGLFPAQLVGSAPVAFYWACSRCQVTTRTTGNERPRPWRR